MDVIEVFISHRFSEEALDDLRAVSPRLRIRQQAVCAPGEYQSLDLSRVQVMYAAGTLPEEPSFVPKLRWVQLHWAGVDRFLDHPLRHTSVLFTNASGVHATPIAEHVFASILAWNCKFTLCFQNQQQAEYPLGSHRDIFARPELRGRTLGIVGYGSVGREVGRLGAAFGMRVLACNRTGRPRPNRRWSEPGVGDPEGRIPDAWYAPDQLCSMLAECDFAVLATPLTNETQALIGREELAAMKPTAYLVNIARGELVDQEALIDALQEGRIGGAGLDATTPEPLPSENPLWCLENVIITPHVSAMTLEYDRRVMSLFKENLRRFLAGEPMINQVDWEVGY